MPTAYSKPCQKCKMMRHIEKPGLVRTVYLNNSGIFSNIHPSSAMLKDIKAYGGIFKH